jgi:monoterpene epsilon-lactone hydrolase
MRTGMAMRTVQRARPRWFLPLAAAVSLSAGLAAAADTAAPPAHVDPEGVAHVTGLDVPPSKFMSAYSRAKFIELFAKPGARAGDPPDAQKRRDSDEEKNAPLVARDLALWPVDIEPQVIGGVRTLVITPKAGIAPNNRSRVLINLHGGGFVWGEGNGAKTESIPIAGVGRIKVITVAYRLAPEARFPAASEDVAAVYRELLKEYAPQNIGIYGCSAGGILAGEAVAWFQKERLPVPGAIGTFCGSIAPMGGDSSRVGPALVGEAALPDADSETLHGLYFRGASPNDPLVMPIVSEQVLRGFPPTLLIAGSRDFMASSLYRSQAALARAGVETELHIWDGMWHAFLMDPDLPESREVFQVAVSFFDRHLGARSAHHR